VGGRGPGGVWGGREEGGGGEGLGQKQTNNILKLM